MIPRTFRFFPWLVLTLTLLAGGCGGGGGGGTAQNSPPVLDPIGNQVVQIGQTLSFTVTASDPNANDKLLVFASGVPGEASFNSATGLFTWANAGPIGEYTLTFVASDGILNSIPISMVISVRASSNTTPALSLSTAEVTLTENQPLIVTLSASDEDGDLVSLSATGLPPGARFDSTVGRPAVGSFSWTPQLVTPQTLTVVFTASDGFSSDEKTLTLTYTRTSPILAADITDDRLRGITIFPQTTPAPPGNFEIFPGQANFWDIDPDISQFDGGWDQFDGNMLLSIRTETSAAQDMFPFDQSYGDLTFMTPLLSSLDGLKVAAVARHDSYSGPDPNIEIPVDADEGAASAWLNATADSRLQQAVDLRPANGLLKLSWKNEFLVQSGSFFDDPLGDAPYYRVVARDQVSGEILSILFDGEVSEQGVVETTPETRTLEILTPDLSTLAGRQILLSFELRGAHHFSGSYARIDNVSLRDLNKVEYIVNGDFENGMTGWVANSGQQSQNLRAAPQPVGELTVTRHFYTVPNQLWARWTDVLENPTAVPITKQIILSTDLGSDDYGIIYVDDAAAPRALTSWDGTALADGPDRDIGLVFGNIGDPANLMVFSNEFIDMIHDVTIPAGGQVSLVHFALMSGENTGATAVDTTVRATTIDTEIANILNNFCTDPRYRDGMTNEQLNTLQNFTCP